MSTTVLYLKLYKRKEINSCKEKNKVDEYVLKYRSNSCKMKLT